MTFTARLVSIASKILVVAAVFVFVLALFTIGLVMYNETATGRYENVIKTKMDIQSVVSVVEEYKRDNGRYPENLTSLVGKYITKAPSDIWYRPYRYEYRPENDTYRVYTLGYGDEVGGNLNQRDYDNHTQWDLVY